MKTLGFMSVFLFISICIFQIGISAVGPEPRPEPRLLGAKQCTWGPSYWCHNITNAAGCRAVKHCIQTVWEHKKLPPDQSSVCDICLDMVKQARDQLLSNLTESEIEEVFDGSCDLIPVKEIAKECRKVFDNFVPELVDTLASQMDPQVVCHVAGLCNNEKYTKLLATEQDSTAKPMSKVDSCKGCLTVLHQAEKKFKSTDRDHVLNSMLKVCGKMGSLSDGCSNIILTYFTEIYNHLQENLGSDEFCIMAGECSTQFHQHAAVEVTNLAKVGNIDVNQNDDLPCDLCEQLVVHLRDIIIANTTEDEFQRVLLGICKQTKSFADECKAIVEEYYPEIYRFLSDEINGTVLCGLVGICPGPDFLEGNDDTPIAPLVPVQSSKRRTSVPLTQSVSNVKISHPEFRPEFTQLPIERLMPQTLTMIGNTKLCAFCEYFLHFVQNQITDPKNEDKIKEIVENGCNRLPRTVNETCWQFVNTYGDAFVALLAQEIDPSVICPLLSVCKAEDSRDVDVFMRDKGDKPNCPLCLFAITQLEQLVKENKTEAYIKEELSKLCTHFSKQLKEECNSFVTSYADHIVDALLADLTPQEVCVFLKLCSDKTSTGSAIQLSPRTEIGFDGEILTNEIPDQTINGKTLISAKASANPGCVICEFVISQIENIFKDNQTDQEIIQVVKTVCTILPKTVRDDCDNFIKKYGELIITLLQDKVAPQLICGMLEICVSEKEILRDEVQTCAVCKGTLITMAQILQNPKISHDSEHVLDKTCRALPLIYQEKCRQILQNYGIDLFAKVKEDPSGDGICEEVKLCHTHSTRDFLVGANKCTWGPTYWCASEDNAKECGSIKHCQEKVWVSGHPSTRNQRDILVGSNKCTWGPSYWCDTEENASKCSATKHCQEKVWKAERPVTNQK